MDAIVDGKVSKLKERDIKVAKPSQEQAEAAVRTLIAWAGDNPDREGLVDTPNVWSRLMKNSSLAIARTQTPCLHALLKMLKAMTIW